jgi:hypothetical protein
LSDNGAVAIRRLGAVQTRGHGDADALGRPELVMFGFGGDALQRAQRTGNEREHGGPPNRVMERTPVNGRRDASAPDEQDHFPESSAALQIYDVSITLRSGFQCVGPMRATARG